MVQVVLDSSNIGAIVEDATGEPLEPLPVDSGATEPEPVKEETAPEVNAETDDVEGDDGLTPRQKRELTAKMQSAIGKKHRQLKETEEFATESYNRQRLAEQRAEQLERENQQIKAQLKPAPVVEGPPDRAKFETDQAYFDAMVNYQVDRRFKEKQAEDAQRAQELAAREIAQQAGARIERAIEMVPDFKEVTEAVDTPVPPHIAGYMQKSTMLAELGYHFAKHPEVLERLSKLPPDEALVDIGEIKATLKPFAPVAKADDGEGEKPEPSEPNGGKPISKTVETPSRPRAPAPIRPLSSASVTQVSKDEREMTGKEALAAWQKRKHVNLSRRQRH